MNADVQLAVSNNIQAPIDTAAGSGMSLPPFFFLFFVTFSHFLLFLDSENTCSGVTSQRLRSILFGLKQAVGIFNSIEKTAAQPAKDLCESIPWVVAGGIGTNIAEVVCKTAPVAAKTTINIAKVDNMNGMCWQVLDWNTPAISFYKNYNADISSAWLNGKLDKSQINSLKSLSL